MKFNYYVVTSRFWGIWTSYKPYKNYSDALKYAQNFKDREWKIIDNDNEIIDSSINYYERHKN